MEDAAGPDALAARPADRVADRLAVRLRAAGSVFAEEEADALRARARDPEHLEAMARRRVDGEMLEHVLGVVEFCDLDLRIGPGCFVPRRRTRLLARLTVAAVRDAGVRGAGARGERDTGARAPVLLEACAGIAPLASLVQRAVPGAVVHAADVDPVPLVHARENLGPHAGVHEGDLLDALPDDLRGSLDVIAAVPPYVPDHALDLLPHESREHEPGAALRGGSDGTDLARRLVLEGASWLAPAGRILLELNVAQAPRLEGSARVVGLSGRMHPGADGRTGVLELRRERE